MIELDLSENEARLMWCRLIRARKIAKQAMDDENPCSLAYAFSWYDQAFDTISKSIASGISLGPNGLPINPATGDEIDGNETNKP